MNIFKRIWRNFSKRVIHDNRGIWPIFSFLTNPNFWAGVSKVLPAVSSMMNKDGGGGGGGDILGGGGGGGGLLGGLLGGGQQQQPQQSQTPFIPGQLQPFRQMPSYGNLINNRLSYGDLINEMLSKYKGF